MKPLKQDELDSFLKRMEDPNFWYVEMNLLIAMCLFLMLLNNALSTAEVMH
jgi:hypothetical protein